mmetsp:Transcript_2339/g.6806  ORF Transcript_2339/g.6806 Transcript_2339/m.6806 type:complete len:190 (+) Transcript_2339:132-701(+)
MLRIRCLRYSTRLHLRSPSSARAGIATRSIHSPYLRQRRSSCQARSARHHLPCKRPLARRPRSQIIGQDHCTIAPFIGLAALTLEQGSSREKVKCDGDKVADDVKDTGSESEPLDASQSQSAPEVDEDCPFCRFFLDGPCRGEFIQWHACVQTSEKATDCMDAFRPLKACMDENGMSMGETNSEEGHSK